MCAHDETSCDRRDSEFQPRAKRGPVPSNKYCEAMHSVYSLKNVSSSADSILN